jgi:arginyl-tRNA synthetase
MIRLYLKQQLEKAFDSLDLPGKELVLIDLPKNKAHGDFAINIGFRLAPELKEAPQKISADICEALNNAVMFKHNMTFLPASGFVNIHLSDTFLWSLAQHSLSADLAEFPVAKDKILLEYVSANPTGPLHIGHGRWAVLGSAIARVLIETKHHVDTEFYINDAGNQINMFYDSVNAVKEARDVPENGYHGAYIKELAALDTDPLEENVRQQKHSLDLIGVSFDAWFSEKTLHSSGAVDMAIEALKTKGFVFESEGAIWFRSTDFGDDKDRVLIKADGAYTYFAVDVAYHFTKIQRGYTRLINLFGADHHGYVARIRAAVLALGDFKQDDFKIIIGQLVSLMRDGEAVRMSKRTGDMISLEEVIDEIGPDAVRFFLIQKSADSHIEFDLALAKTLSSENPVFYIQYAHARLCSLLRRVEGESPELTTIHLSESERQLLLSLLSVRDVVWECATTLSPHRLAQYLMDLARNFHHFYESCPILKSEGTVLAQRLKLVKLTRDVLSYGLAILGISAPESM